jgi:starch phosphorylase
LWAVRSVETFEVQAAAAPAGDPRRSAAMPKVAYFSPEFGVSEGLPQYSGGLGVLAGDYLKVGAAEGRPLVGVGLFYHLGYFHQRLGREGWQEEVYEELDPAGRGLEPVAGPGIEVAMGGLHVRALVWRQWVGRVPLYLLDTTGAENTDEARPITDRLYGGDVEHRLQQEILLGVGGVRALRAAGEDPALFHSNEGHAGFLVLERLRELVQDRGLGFDEAVELVRAATVFTTHTPVPAGIDHFPRELMERYLGGFCTDLGIPVDRLMALGHFPEEDPGAPFNMAVFGLRMSGRANAVSELHREVSQEMFRRLWPGLGASEVPIAAVTNGVDVRSWASSEAAALLDSRLGPSWDRVDEADFSQLLSVPGGELWEMRRPGRQRLIAGVRERLRHSLRRQGVPDSELEWTARALDEDGILVGFARRVATYKRGDLLFAQPERLRRLLLDPQRPLQLVFAGKAHPKDEEGKRIIQQLALAAGDPELRSRLVFLEDYDLALARLMYQGADVWLNTPRRPMEACGTSGQKAAVSGAINLSILDGWWDEGYREGNGFAIPSFEDETDLPTRDRLEAEALFQLLEDEVLPTFYDRDHGGLPQRWLEILRQSMATVTPLALGSRMLEDYVRRLYLPAATSRGLLEAGDGRGALALAGFRAQVHRSFGKVRLAARSRPAAEGGDRLVEAVAELGELRPHQVEVQLLHGPVTEDGQLAPAAVETMLLDQTASNGRAHYRARLSPVAAGRYGFAVRALAAPPLPEPVAPDSPVVMAEPLRLRR